MKCIAAKRCGDLKRLINKFFNGVPVGLLFYFWN